MNEINMSLMLAESTYSKFIRLLACKIWTPYELMNRAIDIDKLAHPIRYEGRSPVKVLERNKLRLLISMYYCSLYVLLISYLHVSIK